MLRDRDKDSVDEDQFQAALNDNEEIPSDELETHPGLMRLANVPEYVRIAQQEEIRQWEESQMSLSIGVQEETRASGGQDRSREMRNGAPKERRRGRRGR